MVSKWKPILGLQNWIILVAGTEEPHAPYSMMVHWEPHYKTATLTVNFNVPQPEIDFGTILEEIIVHELCHIVLAPIRDVIEDEIGAEGVLGKILDNANESLTEDLASIVFHLQKEKEALEKQLKGKK